MKQRMIKGKHWAHMNSRNPIVACCFARCSRVGWLRSLRGWWFTFSSLRGKILGCSIPERFKYVGFGQHTTLIVRVKSVNYIRDKSRIKRPKWREGRYEKAVRREWEKIHLARSTNRRWVKVVERQRKKYGWRYMRPLYNHISFLWTLPKRQHYLWRGADWAQNRWGGKCGLCHSDSRRRQDFLCLHRKYTHATLK